MLDGSEPIPLTAGMRLTANGSAAVTITDPLAAGLTGPARAALDRGQQLVLAAAGVRSGLVTRRTDERLASARTGGEQRLTDAVRGIAALLGPLPGGTPKAEVDHFDATLRHAVGSASFLGIEFVEPPPTYRRGTDPVAAIAMAAGVRHRRVALNESWQRHASGPVLAFRRGERSAGRARPAPARRLPLLRLRHRRETIADGELLAGA